MISLVDNEGNGAMNFNEFVRFMFICQHGDPKDFKKILFISADENFNNSVDVHELRRLFIRMESSLNGGEVGILFKAFCKGGMSGNLTWDEFK